MNDCKIRFPLSPTSDLNDEAVNVYFDYLDDALSEKQAGRINNIALTGWFGIGKSTIIHSYEKHRQKEKCKSVGSGKTCEWRAKIKKCVSCIRLSSAKGSNEAYDNKKCFLYVSVGEYNNIDENTGENHLGTETKTVNAIERRMLLQIFSRFHRADLPQSSFRLIPEEWSIHNRLLSFVLGLAVFAVCYLCFYGSFNVLLNEIKNMDSMPKWIARNIQSVILYMPVFKLILSVFCVLFVTMIVNKLYNYFIPQLRISALTVKGSNAELSVEREATESYLDLYSMELVYCLEKLVDRIDGAVVFEDLDRLNAADCLHIITRLREINGLVNLRLREKNKHICFIYAINDRVLNEIRYEKIFDYILPVFPEINKRSSATLFNAKMEEIDLDYGVSNAFPHYEKVFSCLNDYRLQNTIINEYQVLLDLHKKLRDNNKVPDATKNEILAFVIYKNCWPGDYDLLKDNNSEIFTDDGVKCPDSLKAKKYGELLRELTDQSNHLLTIHSLYYLSFDETKLAESYLRHWLATVEDPKRHNEIANELNLIQQDEKACLKAVQEFCKGKMCWVCSNLGKIERKDILFRAIVKCMVRCNHNENDWFFNSNNSLRSCLQLLAALDNPDDEQLKRDFFMLTAENKTINSLNFYATTFDDIVALGSITFAELKELCRGVKSLPNIDVVRVVDRNESVSELLDIIQDEFEKANTTPYF